MEENETVEGQKKGTEDTVEVDRGDDISWEEAGLGSDDAKSSDDADDASWEEAGMDTSHTNAEGEGEKTESGDGGSAPPPLPKFTDLKNDPSKAMPSNLEFILDISLEVSVELGRTRMLVNDLLQLGQGSIVALEKAAGESLEILVNGKLIAKGEVVVVNEKYGVRLTEVVSPTERIEQLG